MNMGVEDFTWGNWFIFDTDQLEVDRILTNNDFGLSMCFIGDESDIVQAYVMRSIESLKSGGMAWTPALVDPSLGYKANKAFVDTFLQNNFGNLVLIVKHEEFLSHRANFAYFMSEISTLPNVKLFVVFGIDAGRSTFREGRGRDFIVRCCRRAFDKVVHVTSEIDGRFLKDKDSSI